jgi:phosphoribosyl-dephospho-CoA transferase
MVYKRHDLIEITKNGRLFAYEQLIKSVGGLEYLKEVEKIVIGEYGVATIPGIIRREESQSFPGQIPIGFSSPMLYEGRRLRIPAFIPENEVARIISPYTLTEYNLSKRMKALEVLYEIKLISIEMGIELGVWGSTALEIYTSLPYVNENSDLDLLMKLKDIDTIEHFKNKICLLGKKYNTKIDLEIDLPNGYGVKGAELFMETQTVLGKGLYDVKLITKKDIIIMINELSN